MTASGHCLCEGVRFRITGTLRPVANCHCEACRRTTGHFLAATASHRDDVIIESDETLSWYRPSEEVKYGFCHRCGATVFWHTDANPEFVSIAAGMIDVPTGLETHFALNTHEASDYYNLDASIAGLDDPAPSTPAATTPAPSSPPAGAGPSVGTPQTQATAEPA